MFKNEDLLTILYLTVKKEYTVLDKCQNLSNIEFYDKLTKKKVAA